MSSGFLAPRSLCCSTSLLSLVADSKLQTLRHFWITGSDWNTASHFLSNHSQHLLSRLSKYPGDFEADSNMTRTEKQEIARECLLSYLNLWSFCKAHFLMFLPHVHTPRTPQLKLMKGDPGGHLRQTGGASPACGGCISTSYRKAVESNCHQRFQEQESCSQSGPSADPAALLCTIVLARWGPLLERQKPKLYMKENALPPLSAPSSPAQGTHNWNLNALWKDWLKRLYTRTNTECYINLLIKCFQTKIQTWC